eukprot:TRINITY_DN6265_c0_g1_i1.p1 TRINITY_DN6265_c0_g1~~TRINITY_DN6265_c0_g1_i1.p1  ORF type:complete len:156 (-),score=18.68 TRINITY_DN6265_c0_g1_i1:56-523(-)
MTNTDVTEQWAPTNKALPMVVRKNIKDFEPKIADHLKKVNDVLGGGFTFRYQGLTPDVINSSETNSYKDRIGEASEYYWRYTANLIADSCKDEMTKEAFVDSVSNKQIVNRYVDEDIKASWKVVIEDGKLVVIIPMNKYWSGSDQIAYFKLDSLL